MRTWDLLMERFPDGMTWEQQARLFNTERCLYALSECRLAYADKLIQTLRDAYNNDIADILSDMRKCYTIENPVCGLCNGTGILYLSRNAAHQCCGCKGTGKTPKTPLSL